MADNEDPSDLDVAGDPGRPASGGSGRTAASGNALSDLLRRANLSAPDLLVADVAASLAGAGCASLAVYLIDYNQEVLRCLALAAEMADDEPAEIRVEGTMAGRAFQHQTVITSQSERGWTVWSPIRQRAERIGVLEIVFEHLPDDATSLCEDIGRLVGHLVRTADQYTDALELTRRREPMSLAAEVQWNLLLPPLAFASPDVALAGILEPAYDVAGDGFDYSLNGEILTFAILDAMGHGLASSVASALSISALRYGRLRGMPLEEIAKQIDEALISQFDQEMFVTGHLMQLDTATGEIIWINAGHPDPMLIRGTTVAELHTEPCFPLGLGVQLDGPSRARLQPHDRLLFYSDGVIEARPTVRRPTEHAESPEFGFAHLRDRLHRHLCDHLTPAEIIRRIVKEVMAHRGGPLADDATMVMIEWQPDAPD